MPESFPPYTPMSSLGHELGIMFGFMGACLVVMGIYAVVWQVVQRKSAEKDLARRKDLHRKGFQSDRTAGVHEKMVDRYASPANRVELPADSKKAALERNISPLSVESTGAGGKGKSGIMREIF